MEMLDQDSRTKKSLGPQKAGSEKREKENSTFTTYARSSSFTNARTAFFHF
jgi:hypothetical protein